MRDGTTSRQLSTVIHVELVQLTVVYLFMERDP